MQTQGRVAIVTGGASGIGRAVAEGLAAQGYAVVVADRSAEQGQAVADAIGGMFVNTDLAVRADCRRLVDQTLERYGRVDVLVNNAGFQSINPIENFDEDTWDRMLSVMLTAPFLLTKYVWPSMKANGWGRIVNIGSVHSLRASPFKVGYISAKHGLMGLTKTAALEGGEVGITINTICPAYVRTPLVESQIADQSRTRGIPPEDVVEKIMLAPASVKRLIEPAEVAATVVFLCSDAGGTMTGLAIPMDMGWLSH